MMPAMTNLFQAAGLERAAPRPLADRLRPKRLAEVVGQDHLVGPQGTLTRMLASKRPQSMILWGPPGTGKTTVARLLADEANPAFGPLPPPHAAPLPPPRGGGPHPGGGPPPRDPPLRPQRRVSVARAGAGLPPAR